MGGCTHCRTRSRPRLEGKSVFPAKPAPDSDPGAGTHVSVRAMQATWSPAFAGRRLNRNAASIDGVFDDVAFHRLGIGG